MNILRYNEAPRVKKYRPDLYVEYLLQSMNESIRLLEKKTIEQFKKSRQPIIFFCSCPRSGSTVLGQVMARTGCFNYVSNFMARFWQAPYIGGIIERELKLREHYKDVSLLSEYGVSKSYLDPHEFQFFWNYWMPDLSTTSTLVNKKLFTQAKRKGLQKEINAMLHLYNKPFFFKNGDAGMNAGLLQDLLPNAHFIFLKRKHEYIAQSIYQVRKKMYNDIGAWWSTKPSAYLKLSKKDGYTQIAGQILEIHRDFETQLAGNKNVLEVWYEDFCAHPRSTMNKIFELISYEPPANWEKHVPQRLISTNKTTLSNSEFSKLKNALARYAETEMHVKKHGLAKKFGP
jgi:Fe-S cluster biosynthesis and repair protein YggX